MAAITLSIPPLFRFLFSPRPRPGPPPAAGRTAPPHYLETVLPFLRLTLCTTYWAHATRLPAFPHSVIRFTAPRDLPSLTSILSSIAVTPVRVTVTGGRPPVPAPPPALPLVPRPPLPFPEPLAASRTIYYIINNKVSGLRRQSPFLF